MADLSQTVADVQHASSAKRAQGIAAEAIDAGKAVYVDSSNTISLASNAVAGASVAIGIAGNSAAAGQPVDYVKSGGIDLGATLTVGETYVLSVDGAISPIGDVTIGDYVTILGVATTASNLEVNILASGVQKA